MTALRSIVVLLHPLQGLDHGYFLRRIAEMNWSGEQGRRVVLQHGLKNLPEADACILHLDLTSLPADYVAAAERYPVALNCRPRSIAKRVVSQSLLSATDDYDGPVVVKTDLNHGGLPEARLVAAQAALGRLAGVQEAIARWLPRPWRRDRLAAGYLALPHRSQVPGWIWRDRHLVVERRHVEIVGDLFALRHWFCFGDRGVVSTHLGPDPIVKLATSVKRLKLSFEVPEEIRVRRSELGLDFGKLDYVVTTEGPRLFDVNRTPHNGTRIDARRCRWICRYLSKALDDYAAR